VENYKNFLKSKRQLPSEEGAVAIERIIKGHSLDSYKI